MLVTGHRPGISKLQQRAFECSEIIFNRIFSTHRLIDGKEKKTRNKRMFMLLRFIILMCYDSEIDSRSSAPSDHIPTNSLVSRSPVVAAAAAAAP